MRIVFGIGLFWLTLLLSACASSEVKTMTVYKGLVLERGNDSFESVYEDALVLDEQNELVRYDGGRVTLPLSDCGDDTWTCISDGHIEFAVEKGWSGETTSWRFRSMSYSVVQSPRNSPDDKRQAFFITATPVGSLENRVQPKAFLYSPSEGILAITMHLSGEGGSLIPVTYTRVK